MSWDGKYIFSRQKGSLSWAVGQFQALKRSNFPVSAYMVLVSPFYSFSTTVVRSALRGRTYGLLLPLVFITLPIAVASAYRVYRARHELKLCLADWVTILPLLSWLWSPAKFSNFCWSLEDRLYKERNSIDHALLVRESLRRRLLGTTWLFRSLKWFVEEIQIGNDWQAVVDYLDCDDLQIKYLAGRILSIDCASFERSGGLGFDPNQRARLLHTCLKACRYLGESVGSMAYECDVEDLERGLQLVLKEAGEDQRVKRG